MNNKGIDETGNKYGKWTVIKRVDNPKKNGALFLCRCECGTEQLILGKRLRAKETTQCVNCQAKIKMVDLSGQKFNHLTVLNEFEHRSGVIYWHCLCDCGKDTWVRVGNLTSGQVKSCGCLRYQYHGKDLEDLTGKQFGKLTVINLSEEQIPGRRLWECQCSCGNIKKVPTSDLTTGKIKSCGCLKDIPIGERYGKLVVIGPTEKRSNNGSIIYKCKCDCGNYCEVPSYNLRRGDWKSCGCMKNKSYGEEKISNILENEKIPFIQQKTFDNLKAEKGRKFKFDFFVNNYYVIEYDGKQHYTYSNYGWDTEENFLKTKKNDNIKNNYCFENNIPIIRIPFYLKEIYIEDLIPETSKFLLTINNIEEYYAYCFEKANNV